MRRNSIICIVSLLFMLLLGVMPLFAVAISGSTDHVLLFLPRSVTYDLDKAIDLSAGTSGSTVTASITSISDDPRVFTTDSANNLAIFRIYDTLDDRYMSIPAYNGYTVSDYSSGVFQTDNSVTLRIHTTGVFVHTEHPGSTRDFTLSCILSEAHIKSDGSEYVLCTDDENVNKTLDPGNTYQLSDGTTQTWFRSLGNGDYELYVPSTPTVKAGSNDYYYPLLLRLFDICIKLAAPQGGESLESGYYTTTITIESTSTYTNTLWKGEKTYNQQTGRYKIENEVLTMNMSETITVYGYIGDTSSSTLKTHQLNVSSSTDSFSADLGKPANLYSVAKIDFHATETLRSDTNADIAPNPSNSALVLGRANYYKVYITPTPFTTSTSQYGDYVFKKVTDQNVTIGYDLYMQTSSGEVQLTGTESQTASYINCEPNPYVSNSYTEIFPSSTVIQSVTVNGNVVCLTPKYTVNRETYQGSSLTTYNESWSLSNFYLYIKSKYTSQSAGRYTSDIYVTLVTN